MTQIIVDFQKEIGHIKPLNSVNNGPMPYTEGQTWTNFGKYKELRVPYARTHDASFCSRYGGEHTVDVNFIFPDFDADVNDPASYDFQLTDEYLKNTIAAGTEPFFRLGSKIEHWSKKYNTLPPKDFKKWAEICEHIVAHYTEGWANGYKWKMTYWEIWNEPDMRDDWEPVERKPTWGGTKAQFFDLYKTAACHLKNRFPHLKIGGPAVANVFTERVFGLVSIVKPWIKEFLAFCKDNDVPLDFFSWHCYTDNVQRILDAAKQARKCLDEAGFSATESILNEWNYLTSFDSKSFAESVRGITSIRGAAYSAAVMCACQNAPVDMLMYYDAQPGLFNGLFDYYFLNPLKGYYALYSFSELLALGIQASALSSDGDVYTVAAKGEKKGVLVVYYPSPLKKDVKEKKVCIHADMQIEKVYLTDGAHDRTVIDDYTRTRDGISLFMRPYSFIYIEGR